jgi:glycosyltransferase involved in cell wall biosynthesis
MEVIVVDDASDPPLRFVPSGQEHVPITILRNSERVRVAATRNRGLAAAKGEWVAFLDDDDLWAPGKLVNQLHAADSAGAEWACAGVVAVDEQLRLMRAYGPPDSVSLAEDILLDNVVPAGASNILGRTDVLRDLGGFDVTLDHFADWDMWIRLSREHALAVVDSPAVAYSRHEASMSHSMFTAVAELDHLLHKHRALLEANDIHFDLAAHRDSFARAHLRSGRRHAAAKVYKVLLRDDPKPKWFLRAAVGLAWPGAVHLPDARRRREIPFSWRDETEEWLRPYRGVR